MFITSNWVCGVCKPQIKALHLDVDFIKFEKTAVRGVLPELWGLVPISKETQKLIKPF